jgi:hypothetical protein
MLILNTGALEAAAMAGRKSLEEMLNDHGAGWIASVIAVRP